MARFIRITLLLLLTIVLLGTVIWFLQDIQKKSIKQKLETIATNIDANTEVWTNQQGIAHIVSDSDEGMFFALGYFHASQRLWSMCHWRNIALGRVAEFYGSQYVSCDLFMRALNLNAIAKDIYESADEQTKSVLKSYTDGINAYISKNKNTLSIEFASINVIPEFWKPSDCFLLWRFWGFLLSDNFYLDLTMTDIVKRFNNKGLELLPNYPDNSPYILDDSVKYSNNNASTKVNHFTANNFNNELTAWTSKGYDNILKTLKEVYLLVGRKSGDIGGSTWALKKNEGNILLVNEAFSALGLPSNWMQIHITSPNYNVVGMVIPGIPVVYAGRNNRIAWGQTNLNVDDVDFFIHKFKDEKRAEYLKSDSTYAQLTNLVDSIKIKDKDFYMYYKEMVDEYSILSDNTLAQNKLNDGMNDNYLTFKWTGQIISNEIGALLKVMQAGNWNEFLNATKEWNNPGTCFSYADIEGNIGITPRAFIPVREPNLNPVIANSYWKHSNSWQKTIKSYELPSLYNPSKQFVVASNNALSPNTTPYISTYYTVDSRIKRLTEMLNSGDNYYYRYAQYIQNDAVSIYAREIWQNVRVIFDKYKHLFNSEELKAFYKLEKWNYIMSTNSTSATIFSLFIAKLIEKTFADELKGLYYTYIYNSNIPLMKLKELLSTPNSIWFDDVTTTDQTEHLDFIAVTSFKAAMSELSKLYNTTDSDKWQYAKLHKIDFEHVFNYHQLAKNVTIPRSISTHGGIGTINCQNWNLDNPFYVTSGRSMRFIADMSNNLCYTTIHSGVSGDAISPNYADQIQLWNIGASISMNINAKPTEQFKLSIKLNKN